MSVDELAEKVKSLVIKAQTFAPETNEEPIVILGKKVKHQFMDSGEKVWYIGQVISQVYHKYSSVQFVIYLIC